MPVLVIDKIQQKNDGDFFLMDAKDIECEDGKSLQAKLDSLEEDLGGGEDEAQDFVAEFENALNATTTTES